MSPEIIAFFDEPTFTVTYLVIDAATKAGAIIDPVLDYDHASGKAHYGSAAKVLAQANARGVNVRFVLETHVHADHLSAAPWIKAQTGAKVVIGAHVRDVQAIFRPVFGADDLSLTGAEFDILAQDGDRLSLGGLTIEAIHTPGHTPACVSWKFGEGDVFVGDTLFMPDYGTARADFPGGTPLRFTARSADYCPYPRKPACGCATITRRLGGTLMRGRRQLGRNARVTFTSMTALMRPPLSPCARPETPRSKRQRCCCRPCRSTYALAAFLRQRQMAYAT